MGEIILLSLIILLVLPFFFFALFVMLASFTGAPFVISKQKKVKTMIQLAQIKPGEKVIDLGSGSGIIVVSAAQQGAQAYGFEINPFLVLFAKLRILLSNTKNAHIVMRNFWKEDYKDFDVITIYTLPWSMKRLEKKLKKECKSGTRIVSNTFPFPTWKAEKEKNGIYMY